MTIPIYDTVRRERNKVYQKKYYQKNKEYHKLYNYRKRLLEKLNDEIVNIIDIREYAKFRKRELKKQVEFLDKTDEHKFDYSEDGTILVKFD